MPSIEIIAQTLDAATGQRQVCLIRLVQIYGLNMSYSLSAGFGRHAELERRNCLPTNQLSYQSKCSFTIPVNMSKSAGRSGMGGLFL